MVNPALLAALIAEEMARLPHLGTQAAAARTLGISQPHLSRILAEKASSLRSSTYETIREFLPLSAWPRLEQAILAPAAFDALAEYNQWLARELRPFAMGLFGLYDTRAMDCDWTRDAPAPPKADEIRVDIVARLFATPATRRLIRRYVCDMTSRGHIDPGAESLRQFHERLGIVRGRPSRSSAITLQDLSYRAQLGFMRAVESLVVSQEQPLERDVDEFSADELVAYLEAALRREAILLNREPDLPRAQRLRRRTAPSG